MAAIKNVFFCCDIDIPMSDAVYKVKSVIDSNASDITDSVKIICDVDCIKVIDKIITVPYSYRKENDFATLTAVYGEEKHNFTITFSKWKVVFEDNFDGDSLDMTKWEHCDPWLRDKGFANYFNNEMTFVKDGCLVSRAYDTGGLDGRGKIVNLSGAVQTRGLFEHSYGYYEMCARPHQITGMWGAFWLVTGDMEDPDVDDGTAEYGAEIDIAEMLRPWGVSQIVHWDGWGGHTKSEEFHDYAAHIDVFDGEFHKFALRWSPDEYIFLIDDQVTHRTKAGGICKVPGYVLVTTECGTWGGDWVLKEGEHSDMLVDYVKVWSTDDDFKD